MKLHLTDFWHHGSHHAPGVNDRPGLPDIDLPPTKWENAVYAAVLVLGVPVVVGATMFVVRHLYDGFLWLLPS